MPKRLYDLKCSNKECGREYPDMWLNDTDLVILKKGNLVCDDCHEPLGIMIGRPQFSIRGEGVHNPGKH